jgi:hypothetical protein
VLLLGRFTAGRIEILERLRAKLRELGFVPMVLNFDKPETNDFTETVRLLAGLSRFVIADITNPRSAPLELHAIVPNCMIPLVPIIEEGQRYVQGLVDYVPRLGIRTNLLLFTGRVSRGVGYGACQASRSQACGAPCKEAEEMKDGHI